MNEIKPLNNRYKSLLKKIALDIQLEVSSKVHDHRIIKIENPVVVQTNTFGWCVDIFKFKKIPGRGTVEIWLDYFPNVGRPVLAICYSSNMAARIKKIASCIDGFVDDHITKVKECVDGELLSNALQRKYFNKYLIEPYEAKYFTYYFFDQIKSEDVLPLRLRHEISKQIEWLVRTVSSSLEIQLSIDEDSSAIENSVLFTKHKRRERSKALANAAKIRDSFTCQVCKFNFVDTYGDIGRGFAEAHHTKPLSSLKGNVRTRLHDLVTVCANCHRMLHRMEGKADDYKKLSNRLKKNTT